MAGINGILLENGAKYLSEDELIEIKTQLKEHGMNLQRIRIICVNDVIE